jgi:hypothetical protein
MHPRGRNIQSIIVFPISGELLIVLVEILAYSSFQSVDVRINGDHQENKQ